MFFLTFHDRTTYHFILLSQFRYIYSSVPPHCCTKLLAMFSEQKNQFLGLVTDNY